MTAYAPPVRDIIFVLDHLAPYPHTDRADVVALLTEAGRFAAEVIAPTNRPGDLQGARLIDGAVRTPDGFRAAYARFAAAGWGALGLPAEHGGGGLPLTVTTAVRELVVSANLSFSMAPYLTADLARTLAEHGSPLQHDRYLSKLVSGEWTGTMAITEPQAGSDVGTITARAEPDGTGGYRLTGQKIFISYGDHDLTDQIVHLVLARTPDAPPGAKGLSLFLVPKLLVRADGTLGDRNRVTVVGIEHKLGIRASPTCTLDFDAAYAEIVGAPHDGLRQMFTMMNDARLGVGVQGLALAERAYQQSVRFARERRQGRGGTVPIVDHPDVRRMLLTMKVLAAAMRGMLYATAHAAGTDPLRADLLTPIVKAWCTDTGVEVTSLAIQVHGGMGYVEETGVAQHYRDVRITPIYEGTNGIQALDLVGRKLTRDGGATAYTLLDEITATAPALTDAVAALREATAYVLADPNSARAAATPYLEAFGTLLGGWHLSRLAAAAERMLAAGTPDDGFLAGQVLAARFYATHRLPRVHASVHAVLAGPADLAALTPDMLG